MKRTLFLVTLFSAGPLFATNNRSAVSVNGVDTNPCSVASPCRSLNAAIAVTASGGEVIALDSAGYGVFTIPTSLTVSGAPGVHAALTVTSGYGILVSAASSDHVTIRNLVLIGAGGSAGVVGSMAGDVRVLDCTISGFSEGMECPSVARLTVERCVILDNGDGVFMESANSEQLLIADCLIENSQVGIDLFADSASVTATIVNCRIFGVAANSISATALNGNSVSAVVDGSILTQGSFALSATVSGLASTATIFLANNEVAYFNAGAVLSGAATVYTYGDNRFSEVGTVGPLTSASKM